MEQAADLENQEAQEYLINILGEYFYEMKIFNIYFAIILRAAKRGYPSSQYNTGLAYANGKGTDVDKEQALYWFYQAAKNGNTYGKRMLGYYYFYGESGTVSQDYKQAVYWFEQASDEGNNDAKDTLAIMVAEYQ